MATREAANETATAVAQGSLARSTTLLTPKTRFVLAILLFAGALAYFAFLAFRSANVHYLTVGELEAQGPTESSRLVRAAGKLVKDAFARGHDPLDVRFHLQDEQGNLLPVTHRGEVGQIFFNEHSEIILEGRYTDRRLFETETLIVKCPSKYIALEEGDQQAPYVTENYKASGP